jgi:hypothetical protein
MEQTTQNRGHLAFIEDQVHAAVEAFKVAELKDCEELLKSVRTFIDWFLIEAQRKVQ